MVNEITDLQNNTCPVCRLHNTILKRAPEENPAIKLHCARCGNFDITYKAFSQLNDLDTASPLRPRIAEWIWEQNTAGIVPQISTGNIASLFARNPLQFFERAKRLLVFVADQTRTLGTSVPIAEFLPVTAMLQTFSYGEVKVLANFLHDRGWISYHPLLGAEVLGAGFIQADEWKRKAAQSAQGFVAMWFDRTTVDVWEDGLRKGVVDAGYEPLRIDKTEHVNKICDEIIAQIRRSRFLIADYTGHRAGVYYEAGYASGRDLPVILTCKKDEIDKLHFDVRQFNCIDWQTPAELAERLQARIEAIIGDGPLKSK